MIKQFKKEFDDLFTYNCGPWWSDGRIQPSAAYPRYRHGSSFDKTCAQHDHCMHFANSDFDTLQCDVQFYYANTGQGFIRSAAADLVAQYNRYLSKIDNPDYSKSVINMPYYDPIPFGYDAGKLRQDGSVVSKNVGKTGDPGGRYTPTTTSQPTKRDKRTTGSYKRDSPTMVSEQETEKILQILPPQPKNEGPPTGSQLHVKSLTSLLNKTNAKRRLRNKNASKKKKPKSPAASVKANNGSRVNRK